MGLGKSSRLGSRVFVGSFGCQILICTKADGHEEADLEPQEDSESSTVLLMSKSPGDPRSVGCPLVGEPGPRPSNTLLEERATSRGWVQGPGVPEHVLTMVELLGSWIWGILKILLA